MRQRLQRCHSTIVARLLLSAAVTLGILAPSAASAQQSDPSAQRSDSWKMSLAPLYFWPSSIDGEIATRAGTTPVFMSFDDAVDNLAGAFNFHFEAEKNRVGFFSDLNFVRLSTEADFTLQGPAARTVTGNADVADMFVEAGASYRLSETTPVAVIGGLRTFTVSSEVEFTTPNVSVTPIDASRTAVSGFAGVTYRPALHEKVTLISRADIGGGSGRSWAGMLGFEYRPKPWSGLVLGYKAMGIEFGNEDDEKGVRKVNLTFYGPFFGLNLHWGGR